MSDVKKRVVAYFKPLSENLDLGNPGTPKSRWIISGPIFQFGNFPIYKKCFTQLIEMLDLCRNRAQN
jgi:hypothetical protein